MESRPDAPRALRLGGLLVWLMVGIPTALQGTGRFEAFVVWVGGFVLFGALFAATTASGRSHPPAVRTAALLAQAGAVIVMTAVSPRLRGHASRPRGHAGRLVAAATRGARLGRASDRRPGIHHHWTPRSALLLAPPYLGFQVLAWLAMGALAREMRAAAGIPWRPARNAELLATRGSSRRRRGSTKAPHRWGELHDAMGHSLAALSLNLEALAQAHEVPSAPLETARALTRPARPIHRSPHTAANVAPIAPTAIADVARLPVPVPSLVRASYSVRCPWLQRTFHCMRNARSGCTTSVSQGSATLRSAAIVARCRRLHAVPATVHRAAGTH